MKKRLSNFITALKAEHIKKRGTGFYWTSAVIGMLAPILYGVVSVFQDNPEIKSGIPANFFVTFLQSSVYPFAGFFFPLLIIITISRITQLDHRNGGWQLMETQPVYKFSVYFSKFLTVLIANSIAIASFILSGLLIAWVLTFVITVPKNAVFEMPTAEILEIMLRCFVGSLFVTALQFILSVLIPSFIWSIVIGFFGLLVSLFLSPFKLLPAYYPYDILSRVGAYSQGSDLGYWLTFTEWLSLIASILLLYIGFEWYRHKSFKAAFLSKTSRTLSTAAVLIIFGGLFYRTLLPNQMPKMAKTTFSGNFKSDQKYHTAYVVDFIIQDTIAVIPITHNSFHYTFDKPVVSDYYALVFDGKFKKNVYFSTNDSIFIEGNLYQNQDDFKVKGTRLAENQMATEVDFTWSMAEYYLNENIDLDQPDKISKAIYEEWKAAVAKPSDFRTVDNYVAKNDFAGRTKKLASVKYLDLWNDLVKKRAALYPDQKTTETQRIKEIKASLSLSDESLLSTPEYFNYIRSQLIVSDKNDVSDNQKALDAIVRLKNGKFKDKMLFWQLKKSIEETAGTEQRNGLLAQFNSKFENPKYTKRIRALNKSVESLGRGKQAPALTATSIDKNAVTLEDFKGKFLILDVWATWCGPCKQQSPFFEKFALKYKGENVRFAALSTDMDIAKWFIEAKTKRGPVLQLHADDPEKFGSDYSVESIPRFILIGPDGKFINARLPYPSDPSFEILLRKELGLPEEK